MIPGQFKKTLKLYSTYSAQVAGVFLDEELTPEDEIKLEYLINPKTKNYWSDDLAESYVCEYKNFHNKAIYFSGCKINVYKESYDRRLQEYLGLNDESDELDFIKSELENIIRYITFEFAPKDLQLIIKRSLEKQTDFLERKLESLGYLATYEAAIRNYRHNAGIVKLKRMDLPPAVETESLDDLELKPKEKLIALHELGILEFLLANPSLEKNVFKISKILGPILNIKPTTLNSYLNPILNELADPRNDPYNNTAQVEKIRYFLKNFGFKKMP